jgi:hypothetical protein
VHVPAPDRIGKASGHADDANTTPAAQRLLGAAACHA